MIVIDFLKDLIAVFPNGGMSVPIQGASFIYDKRGEILGHIDWQSPTVYLHQGYTHVEAAGQALTGQGVRWEKVDGKLPEQNLEPDDTGEVLYGEPDQANEL